MRVEQIEILTEIPALLKNPVFRTENGSLSIQGDIPSEHYLRFRGGSRVSVYDLNWNHLDDLSATNLNFKVPPGSSKVMIESGSEGPAPWLEVQFVTSGTPAPISK